MSGVAGSDTQSQMCFVRDCCLPALAERLKRGEIYEQACRENGAVGYGPIEAEFLFCFIAAKRPDKIVQVGSGVSTAVIQAAANEVGYKPQIVCIDPFPTDYLVRAAERNLIELIPRAAQEVDIALLTALNAGDLLFVDSTHTTRAGSEVNRIILEVLPQLPSGVFVHFHDIFFPYDYQSNLLETLFFWGESTLLHAFLIHNRRYRIAASLSMLHHACSKQMQSLLPNYRPAVMDYGLCTMNGDSGHFPSATYLAAL
jgi:Methyltransferase domain